MAKQRHPYGVNDEIQNIADIVSQLIEQRHAIVRMRQNRETTVVHAGGDPSKDAAHSDLQLAVDQISDTMRKLESLTDCIAESGDFDNYTRTGRP
jgi:hypothetical protein